VIFVARLLVVEDMVASFKFAFCVCFVSECFFSKSYVQNFFSSSRAYEGFFCPAPKFIDGSHIAINTGGVVVVIFIVRNCL